MPCPVCKTTIESGADHRPCVFQLFESNTIRSVEEWEVLSTKPLTIVKGRVRARIPRESFTMDTPITPNAT